MKQIFNPSGKIKLSLYFLLAIFLTLGLSLVSQSALAVLPTALMKTFGTSIQIGSGSLALTSTQNLIYEVLSGSTNGSFVLFESPIGVHKFRVDYNGNIAEVGNITAAGNITAVGTIDGQDISAKAPVWDAKEPAISSGTAAQYWRGDKTWQTLPVGGSGDLTDVLAGTGISVANPTGPQPTVSLNLANANTWTGTQTFGALQTSQASVSGNTINTKIGVSEIAVNYNSGAGKGFTVYDSATIPLFRVDNPGGDVSITQKLTLRGYTGGTVGSAVAAYTKTLEMGGVYNQTYNSGNAVLLHIGDYSNDVGDNVYPIYVEDENNNVAFYINGGTSGGAGTAYFGGNVGLGVSPTYKLDVLGDVRWTGILQGGSVPWTRLSSFPAACLPGQYVTGVGATLSCGTPAGGGGGDITDVLAGVGISVANSAGPNPTVTADTAYLQRRVSSACAAGSSIRVVNADGTVTCQTDNVGGGTDYTGYINFNDPIFGTFLGNLTGSVTTGRYNSFVGYHSGFNNTIGGSNSAVGYDALYSNTSGNLNSAVGTNALSVNTTGGGNSAVGFDALYANTTGSGNTAIGVNALFVNTTGNYNLALGYIAGSGNTTGSNNIIIGQNIDLPAVDSSNMLSIGNLIYATGLTANVSPSTAVSTTGKVGIGTASPGYKFSVVDTGTTPMVNIWNNSAANQWSGTRLARGGAVDGTEKWFIGMSNADDKLRFRRANTADDMVIDTAGNVGIGTSPGEKLTVDGNIRIPWGSATDRTIEMFYDSSYKMGILMQGNSRIMTLYNNRGDGNGNTSLTLNNGNVGIGAQTPAQKLQVNGNIDVSGYYSFNNNPNMALTGVNSGKDLELRSRGAIILNANLDNIYTGFTTNPIFQIRRISGRNPGGDYPLLTILDQDFLGIGTDQPDAPLVVQGGAYLPTLRVRSTQATAVGLDITPPFYSTPGDQNSGLASSVAGFVLLGVGNGPVAPTNRWQFYIQYRNNVNNSSTEYIEQGTRSTLFRLDTAGNGYFTGSVNAAGVWLTSDRRLKENITYFDNTTDGLDKIIQLKPAKFDFIKGDKNQLGFIAQDVKLVIPEAVVANDTNGMLAIRPDSIIPYLVQAVKELAAKITDLTAKVEDLFKKVTGHDERIQALEKQNKQLQQQLNDLKNQVQAIKNK